jgi:exonuclease SbcC
MLIPFRDIKKCLCCIIQHKQFITTATAFRWNLRQPYRALAQQRLTDLNTQFQDLYGQAEKFAQSKSEQWTKLKESIVETSIEAPELEHIDAWFTQKQEASNLWQTTKQQHDDFEKQLITKLAEMKSSDEKLESLTKDIANSNQETERTNY